MCSMVRVSKFACSPRCGVDCGVARGIARSRLLQSAAVSTVALSVAGFVPAIVANVWTFGLTFVRWPRVSVETHAHMFIGGEDRDKIVLVVINRGSEAVTISGIGVRPEDPSFSGRRDFEYDDLHHPDRLPETLHDPLPVRLEGHGALRWVYGAHQLEEFRNGTNVRGYAKVYRAFRWRSEITLAQRTVAFCRKRESEAAPY